MRKKWNVPDTSWAADGKVLAFMETGGESGPEIYVRPSSGSGGQVKVSTDGQRILVYKDLTGTVSSRREPAVVINWFDELESKVPASR